MQDGDHTDGHYITLFAEQLTRTSQCLFLNGQRKKKVQRFNKTGKDTGLSDLTQYQNVT